MFTCLPTDPASKCINGDVRLANSTQANAGRVEICYNNHYGTVCEDDWTTEDANVVCGQLGYEKYGKLVNYMIFCRLYYCNMNALLIVICLALS